MDPSLAIYFDGIMTAINNFILFGLVVLFRRTVHQEGIRSFLLHADSKGIHLFFEGTVIGFLSFLLYPLILMVSGEGAVTVLPDTLSRTIGLLVTAGIGFFGVALLEEGLFRGYILQKLLTRLSQPVAIGIVAIPFGILHLISYPSSDLLWLGLLNASLFGVLFSVVVIDSGSLMWAIGFHFAWDLTQTIFLMNQYNSVRTVLNLRINEGFLAGTPFTPESGIVVTAILVVLGLYILARFHRRGTQLEQDDSDAG